MRLRARVAAPLGRLATGPVPARALLLGGLRMRPDRVPPDDGASELESFGTSRAFQATLLATVGGRVAERLRDIDVPVRVVYGTADLMLGALTAPRFAGVIPGADLVAIPRAGHVPMADAPAAVARAILEVTAT
jgi:pimeloyl-ACP methyl ester carboxylesterase